MDCMGKVTLRSFLFDGKFTAKHIPRMPYSGILGTVTSPQISQQNWAQKPVTNGVKFHPLEVRLESQLPMFIWLLIQVCDLSIH